MISIIGLLVIVGLVLGMVALAIALATKRPGAAATLLALLGAVLVFGLVGTTYVAKSKLQMLPMQTTRTYVTPDGKVIEQIKVNDGQGNETWVVDNRSGRQIIARSGGGVDSPMPIVPTSPAAPPASVPAAPSPTKAQATSAIPPTVAEPSASDHGDKKSEPPAVAEKLPEARPAWVDRTSGREGQSYETTVKSGLYATYLEAERAVEKAEKKSVDEYVEQYLGEGTAEIVNIDGDYINRSLRKALYHEEVNRSVGAMQQIYARIVIDDKARKEFKNRLREVVVVRRLYHVANAAILVLVLLATFFAYLKLDLKTAGTHSRRLQFSAALTILLAVACAIGINRLMPF